MRELLTRDPLPTAVFAANDLLAMGAMTALLDAGLRVPEDIAIIGFDDIPAAKLVRPPLTTISQFPEQLGRRAAGMLFERLTGAVSGGGRAELMPHKLIIRESA
jgi:LacI family transcriptional regulator